MRQIINQDRTSASEPVSVWLEPLSSGYALKIETAGQTLVYGYFTSGVQARKAFESYLRKSETPFKVPLNDPAYK